MGVSGFSIIVLFINLRLIKPKIFNSVASPFFSIWIFFHNHSRIKKCRGRRRAFFLTPHYHFHPITTTYFAWGMGEIYQCCCNLFRCAGLCRRKTKRLKHCIHTFLRYFSLQKSSIKKVFPTCIVSMMVTSPNAHRKIQAPFSSSPQHL